MSITKNKLKFFLEKANSLPWRIGSPIALLLLRDCSQIKRFEIISRQYADLYEQLDPNGEMGRLYASTDERYPWQSHISTLRKCFSQNLPVGFLRNPIISAQMVATASPSVTREKISLIESVWPADRVSTIIREDYIGLPRIANFKYLTSGVRIHHAYHLASYKTTVGKSFESFGNIVEWGGGYGDMARLIRRLNAECTYTIIDLPELSALQYIYLHTLLGDDVNLITSENRQVKHGKVNIVPVGRIMNGETILSAQAFLSTWAITESPPDAQEFISKNAFFGARSVLLAYHNDSHNRIKEHLPKSGFIVKFVPFLSSEHFYAFL